MIFMAALSVQAARPWPFVSSMCKNLEHSARKAKKDGLIIQELLQISRFVRKCRTSFSESLQSFMMKHEAVSQPCETASSCLYAFVLGKDKCASD
jgi:hypothetical protein